MFYGDLILKKGWRNYFFLADNFYLKPISVIRKHITPVLTPRTHNLDIRVSAGRITHLPIAILSLSCLITCHDTHVDNKQKPS